MIIKNYQRKTKYVFFLVCFALMLICPILLLDSDDTLAVYLPYSVEIPRDDFPVRSAAVDSSTVLISLAKGSLLYPESISGSWYKVPFKDNQYGYVHKSYVTEKPGVASVKTTPGAALYSETSGSSTVLSLCSFGTEITITGQNDGWFKGTPYGIDTQGFINGTHLTFNKVYYDILPIATGKRYVVTTNNSNVRSGAGTSYSILATLPAGAVVSYVKSATGSDGVPWYQVTTSSGVTGYIRSSLLRLLSDGTSLAGKTIVIDPGHGSIKSYSETALDPGAIGAKGLKEKDVNLKVAAYLKADLQGAGANVIMTRYSDVGYLTLNERAEIANNNKADLFVSIHCNSVNITSIKGTETYYSVGNSANPISSLLLQQRKKLATSVQKYLVQQLGTSNRGVKTAHYTVILKTTMPSILIETAFLSNSSEESLLNTSSFQEKAAKGAYLGIVEYFK